jgi:hypothetical protein
MQFDIRSIPPLKEFQFNILRYAKGISDWKPLFHSFGSLFKAQMVEQFETEGKMSGKSWPKLSDAYAAWKEQKYPGNPIGVLTGAMRSAMIGGVGYSELILPTSASYGMSESSPAVGYAHYFNDGTEKMPARPVIRVTPRWGTQFQKLTALWLREQMMAAGLMGKGSGAVNPRSELGLIDATQTLPST